MDVFEALYTTRAMRRIKPDPIPDDVAEWTSLALVPEMSARQRVELITADEQYQYYLLWATTPGETEDGFGIAISDVKLFD